MSQHSLNDGQKIVFHKHDTIGLNEALDDKDYLLNCFIDLGDLQQIKDFDNKKCLLLGRTGVGKTAIITKLQDEVGQKVIIIDPEALAMRHISNSTIIQYLIGLGIDLNTFYKFLWRHEICVEIFNRHLKINSVTDYDKFVEDIKFKFRKKNTKHLKALQYLEEWKDTFWKSSDDHVTNIITKTEDEISATIGSSSEAFKARIGGKGNFSQEEIKEIKQYGQAIVNEVQIRQVMGLLDMLDDFIEFHQTKYYVVVDRLDEKWVGNSLRYKLIKALIETLRDLNRLSNIKPVATLRHDLMSQVFDISNDTAFQEEKLSSLYLSVRWNKEQLAQLLNERINFQFRSRYSKKTKLTHEDIFPETIDGLPSMTYILERTLLRPRDLIEFVNICIHNAIEDNKGILTEQIVLESEKIYSKDRLKSLYYEWAADYPGLKELVQMLKKKSINFQLSEIDIEVIKDICLKYAANPPATDIDVSDSILRLAIDVTEDKLDAKDFLYKVMIIFHTVGLVGIKESDSNKISWSKSYRHEIDWDDLDEDATIYIHPCFRKALKVIT